MTNVPMVVLWGLKATPLFLAAWLLTLLLRHASAATRHLVWSVALGAALGLPVAGLIAPRWELRVLPAINEAGPPTVSTATAATPSPAASDPAPASPAAPASHAEGAVARVTAPLLTPTGIWLAGALAVGLLVALSLARTARAARTARGADHDPVAAEVRAVADLLGVRRHVRVRIGGPGTMPMTWGAIRPVILLPSAFADWPTTRQRTVLLHELAHVQRWDWLTQLAAQVACALYWWHPLAWIAARHLREERELACDDVVLTHGATASAYAHDLLEIARRYRTGPAFGAVAMARRSQLAGRLLAVLDGARARSLLARRHALPAAGAGLAVVLPLAGVAAGHAAQDARPVVTSAAAYAVAAALPDDPAARVGGASPVQERATLCDWSSRGNKNSSSSTKVDDDRMMIQIARDDCTISVRAQGQVTFAENDRDVERLARDGYFEIEERLGRERRSVEIAESGGTLSRRWRVNGTEQAWDNDARAWLGDALLVLFRRTGLNAEARAHRILRQGGANALIAEIALMQSDWAASQYYIVLFEGADLTTAQQATLLEDAGRRIESDHALSRVLTALAARGPLDRSVQQAYVGAAAHIESDHAQGQALAALAASTDLSPGALDAMLTSATSIGSDFERATLLLAVADRYPGDRPLPTAYLAAVGDMRSDHERGRVLGRLLERDRLATADRVRVLETAARIGSDHEQAEILVAVLRGGTIEPAMREPFFNAVDGLGSSFERQRVLVAAVGAADPATLMAVVESARAIRSDHSMAEVLLAVANRGLSTDALRRAYLDAAGGIQSRAERERVLQAAGMSRI